MAWTAPRDWSDNSDVPDGIVTAAMLNVDVRDNSLVLSTHSHTGSAGQGASSMSGLTLAALVTLTFANQSANPDAAGELQRNGNDLLFYGSSVVNLTAADASAGTASLRTLGTTSVKAAAGNHTHTPSNEANGSTHGIATITSSEVTIVTHAATPGAAGRVWIVMAAFAQRDGTDTYTLKLYDDTTVLVTLTGVTSNAGLGVLMKAYLSGPSAVSHTLKLTGQRTDGVGDSIIDGEVGFWELSV